MLLTPEEASAFVAPSPVHPTYHAFHAVCYRAHRPGHAAVQQHVAWASCQCIDRSPRAGASAPCVRHSLLFQPTLRALSQCTEAYLLKQCMPCMSARVHGDACLPAGLLPGPHHHGASLARSHRGRRAPSRNITCVRLTEPPCASNKRPNLSVQANGGVVLHLEKSQQARIALPYMRVR